MKTGNRQIPRRLRRIVDLAVECRWTVDYTRHGHLRITPPTGRPALFTYEEGDRRDDLNSIALLRRQGLPLPHKGALK